jgi:hypothetical protein
MQKLLVVALLLSVCAWFTPPASAQEKKAKGGAAGMMMSQLLKALEKAELTEEQTLKIKERYMKVATEVDKLRTDAGISPDIVKKRVEAAKAAKDSGKKAKEMQESLFEAMGLTDDQKKVFIESEEKINKAKMEIGKMLSEEQMAKLPAQVQAQFKVREGGKKAKAK